MLAALLVLVAVASGQRGQSVWKCDQIDNFEVSANVAYVALNCTGAPAASSHMTWRVGPTVFHLVYTNLSTSSVFPVTADPTAKLQILPDMLRDQTLAAINGGYFWEVLNARFFDDKSRKEAEQNVSAKLHNHGLGDTLVRIGGKLMSCNCDLPGLSHPVALVMNGTSSRLVLLRRGEQLDAPNVLANSPLLVLGGRFAIPADDLGLNRWSHSSNSAVGLLGKSGAMEEMVMVASDGHDGCARSDPTCGIEAEPMAYFMLDVVGAEEALELDQGGSSTLWVKGRGIVNSNRKGPRKIFSGIAVQ